MILTGALAAEVSPVQKVIQLLDELKGKVEDDLANEEGLMEDYTKWCDKEALDKERSITSAKRTIGDLMATIQDAKATMGTLTSSIDELTQKISAGEADLATATKLREKEHGVFLGAEKELVETVDSLERAHTVIKSNLGLIQGKAAGAVQAVAQGLRKVVEASWVNEHQKATLQSLLQTQDEDTSLSLQPASDTGGIVDTIADMQEKAEESLSSTRKDEMEAAHAFALLKQGIEDEVKVAQKQLAESTLTRSTTEEELHDAEGTLAETEKTLAADTDYLHELKQSCEHKSVQWAERQKQAGEETAAIAKAKEILSGGVKVFLQTSVRTQSKAHLDSVQQARDRAGLVLKALAKKVSSYALAQLAQRVKSDPFGKIRGLIEEMISKLVKEAGEEADQKAFCDEETSESKSKQADLTGKLDKTSARIEKAEAGKAKLTEEVKNLESEIADIDAGQAEATVNRNKEHEEFLKVSADAKDSATAVAKAIDVLSEYYSKAAFVQVSQPDFGGAKGDVGSSITSILEMAESDFTRMLAEAEADESSAQEAYDKLTQENAVAKAAKAGDVKGKTNELKQLAVALGNYKENKEATVGELDAVLQYLDKLKPQCETKVMSYAEQKAKRDAEISGLKEALTILSGESLLQTSSSLRGARRV
jgi:chromosome segregation ATPase